MNGLRDRDRGRRAPADRVVRLWNDQRMGMVEHGHRAVYGRDAAYPIAMDVGNLARGLGAEFARAERPTDILALRERIAQLTGPLVVDVLIDPDVRMPTRDRLVTMDSSKKRMN
jgi:thiamine pyrophosphate-dependent acetolactate synthase large subunit-like protein